jgi:hypothetical protein
MNLILLFKIYKIYSNDNIIFVKNNLKLDQSKKEMKLSNLKLLRRKNNKIICLKTQIKKMY